MKPVKIYYRLNIAGEKDLLLDCKSRYHGVVVGAHILALGKNWISPFLKKLDKPFFIDPVTYVFSFDLSHIRNKKGDLRKSYELLTKKYRGVIKSAIGNDRSLSVDDLSDSDKIDDFSKSVIDFQRNVFVEETPSQKSISDYAELLGEGVTVGAHYPEFLVSPYFYVEDIDDPWYELSLKVSKTSIKYKNDLDLYAMICVSHEMLKNNDMVSQIISDYRGFDGYVLSISGFDEYKKDEEILEGFIQMVSKLSEYGKPVVNLYGSYFSFLSSKFGLSAISSGIGMGESKDLMSKTTGGRYAKRYYVPTSKSIATETDARSYYSENFDLLCKCKVCGDIIKDMPSDIKASDIVNSFFDNSDAKLSKKHFIENRYYESKTISESSTNALIDILSKHIQQCQDSKMEFFKINYKHLDTWKVVLEEILTNQQNRISQMSQGD